MPIASGQLDNKIYGLKDEQVSIIFDIDLGSNNILNYSNSRMIVDGKTGEKRTSGTLNYTRGRICIEAANGCYTNIIVSKGNRSEKLLVSNVNAQAILYANIENDINNLLLADKLYDCRKSDVFCQSIASIDLIDDYERNMEKITYSDETRKLIQGLSPDDNNVLVLIKTK